MKGGALATVDYAEQDVQTSSDQNLKRVSRGFSGHSSFSTPAASLPGTPTSSQLVLLCFQLLFRFNL